MIARRGPLGSRVWFLGRFGLMVVALQSRMDRIIYSHYSAMTASSGPIFDQTCKVMVIQIIRQ